MGPSLRESLTGPPTINKHIYGHKPFCLVVGKLLSFMMGGFTTHHQGALLHEDSLNVNLKWFSYLSRTTVDDFRDEEAARDAVAQVAKDMPCTFAAKIPVPMCSVTCLAL